MTSILRQENGELFLYRSEKEFPKREDYLVDLNITVCDVVRLDRDLANWFSTAERIKVAEGEKEKFNTFTYHIQVEMRTHEPYKEGILIPESCYEVNGYKEFGSDKPAELLAYFKDAPATEKETNFPCGMQRVYGDVKCKEQCKDCAKEYADVIWEKPPERLHDTPQESQTLMKEQEELWKEVDEILMQRFIRVGQKEIMEQLKSKFFLSRK